MILLCRNRLADFDHWKEIFDSQDIAELDSGSAISLWETKTPLVSVGLTSLDPLAQNS